MRLFELAKFQTVLAVPVFSGKSKTPAFIFCCYSFVRSTSIPFVLKFVQPALKLLWCGLDNVEPHESVDGDVWRQVAPADLGEMAADVEMHQHFIIKKRPIGAILTELDSRDESMNSLTSQINSLENVSGTPVAPSIYAGQSVIESPPQVQIQTFESMQSHIQDAINSVANLKPVHQHIATNANGSKRAHVLLQEPLIVYPQQQSQYTSQESQQDEIVEPAPIEYRPATSNPLPLAQPFRLPNQVVPNQVMPNQTHPDDMEPNQVFLNHMAPNQAAQNNVVHPMNNEYSTPYVQGTQIQYQTNQQPQQQTLYNPSQNQFSDYGVNGNINNSIQNDYSVNNNNNSYSFPKMHHQQQQHQQKQQEEITIPNQVFSLQTNELNGSGTRLAPFKPQNNGEVNGMKHSPPVQSTKPRATSSRSTKTASNTKPCRIQGCDDPALARRPYCVRHSGNRMCEHKGCVKCAQGSTRFCIAHGGGRRCTFPGCDKGARDKFFCAAHGGGKRCKFDGCNKSAVGGSNLCTSHGGGRRCSVEGCDKSAQSSTKFCVKHGGGKKCSFAGCEKVSRGRTQFCAAVSMIIMTISDVDC